MLPVQLSLLVSNRDEACFDNFYISADNSVLIEALHLIADGRERHHHVIWGSVGSGVTHLLHSLCHQASRNGFSAQYLPLAALSDFSPDDVLAGLEQTQVLCLDGVDMVSGDLSWERALFHLFNRLRDANNALVFGTNSNPQRLHIELPDLRSRIFGCPIYQVHRLSDTEKQAALIMRAEARGLRMSSVVARFILNRCSRNMHDLIRLLDHLDDRSLQQQRKLTIPFVKDALHDVF